MSANNFAFKFEKERDFLLVINNEKEQQKIQPKNEEKQSKKNFDENVCGICEKKLSSKCTLAQHMKRLHPNEISSAVYFCDHCGLKFLKKDYLIKHLKSKHQKGKEIKFKCDFDGKIFETKNKLLNHMKSHKALKNCNICGKKLRYLDYHMKEVHGTERKKFQCIVCDKIFKNQILLNYHLKTHNKKCQCQVCGHKFSLKTQLNQHMKYYVDKFAFRCDKCQKNLPSMDHLRKHLKTHDTNRKRKYKCQHCDHSTDNKQNLTRHLGTHNKNREKNFKCSKCNYKTDQKSSLKFHFQTHELNRVKFPCPACSYEATERGNLTRHFKSQHDPNRVKNHKCPHCIYATDNSSDLKKHINSKHN